MDNTTYRTPNVTAAQRTPPQFVNVDANIPDFGALYQAMWGRPVQIPNVEPDYGAAPLYPVGASPLRRALPPKWGIGMVGDPNNFIPSMYQSALRFYGGLR